MTASRRLLITGSLALALLGMAYGLWYAVFAEHQALDHIGSSLSAAFTHAAQRDQPAASASLAQYRQAKYIYDRQVDAHGHWIGLALLLLVIAIGFDRVRLSERHKFLLALALLAGAFLFPLGVLLQAFSHGGIPRSIAIAGSALLLAALASLAAAALRAAPSRTSY